MQNRLQIFRPSTFSDCSIAYSQLLQPLETFFRFSPWGITSFSVSRLKQFEPLLLLYTFAFYSYHQYFKNVFSVELIPDLDHGGFTARVPGIPAYGEGDTEDEAIADLQEALRAYTETYGLEDALGRLPPSFSSSLEA